MFSPQNQLRMLSVAPTRSSGDHADVEPVQEITISTIPTHTQTQTTNEFNHSSNSPVTVESNRANQGNAQQPQNALVQRHLLTLKDFIEHVMEGDHIRNLLKAPPQDYNKGALQPLAHDDLPLIIFKRNFRRTNEGELETINEFLLKKQRKVVGSLVKDFNKALLTGKPISQISLPLDIYLPKSKLEQVALGFACAPKYLELAGTLTDPLAQFKNVLAFWVSSLTSWLPVGKTFDPTLGETFQGLIGGIPVYLEQISDDPSICRFQMYGKKFNLSGGFELFEKISANSQSDLRIGFPKITFPNGTTIYAQLPGSKVKGLNIGTRTFKLKKKLIICDLENKFYFEVKFDKEGGCFSGKTKENDSLAGCINKVTDSFIESIRNDIEKKSAEIGDGFAKKHIVTAVSKLKGSWLKTLEIDGETMWSIQEHPASSLQFFDDSLPSDSKYRLDILFLKAANKEKAQDEINLQQTNRYKDQKLREKTYRKY